MPSRLNLFEKKTFRLKIIQPYDVIFVTLRLNISLMKNLIVAREKEQAVFERLLAEPTAQLLAVYGRRRTGKTFLVREYFDGRFAFQHTAVSPMELKERDRGAELLYRIQLNEFAASLRKYGSKDETPIPDWFDAFHRLEKLLEKKRSKGKMVVFIDELPWLDTPRAGFLSAFEHFWNGWGAGKHNLLLVVCGSATTWMLDNLINSKGGLYGRTTCEMHLHPFTLAETEAYLFHRGITTDRYDVVQTYMLTGGVAYYLSYFHPGCSLAENIDGLFFAENGFLQTEYDRLFTSLFADNEGYRRIVEALSSNRYGLTRDVIAQKSGISLGGTLSNMLKALVKSDLIITYWNYGESKKVQYYKLTDMFCLFYLGFVLRNPSNNRTFWHDNQNSPKINSWRGRAFEDVCFVHQMQIRRALSVGGVQAEIYPWHATDSGKGDDAQIDMLIIRADRVVNLCEMKFSQSEFVITKEYDARLRSKISALQEHTGGKFNVQPTLVTTFGLKQNMYSSRIQRIVTIDNLFEQ